MAATDQVLQELFPWKRVPKKSTSGARVYHWDKPRGSRDEAGDCTRYAYAAMRLVARGFAAGTMWEQLERRSLASLQKDGPQEAAQLLAGLKFG
jgi:phage terminase large subunit GpA-like protein